MFFAKSPFPTYNDTQGNPLESGFLFYGEPNLNPETNPITVYWDEAGTQPALQPIRTMSGYPVRNGTPAVLYVPENFSLTVRDRNRNLVYYIGSAIIDSEGTPSEWIESTLTPSFIDATNFSVVGDQRSTFEPGRRILADLGSSNIYGTITASTFSTPNTTITVALDSGALDSNLTSVSYALISATNTSAPYANVGQSSIASATTCDLGTKTQHVLNLTGTVTITSFGNSMPVGTSKVLKVVSAGLNITPSTNIVLSAGFVAGSARSYLSNAGDVLKVDCIGTSGGNNVYFVTITSIDGTAYQTNDIVGFMQNFSFIPNAGAPNTSIDVTNCDCIVLGTNGDNNQVGVKTAKTKRVTNATLTNINTLTSGLGGLDTGVLQANKDYYLFCVSDGTNYSFVWSLNTNFPDNTAFPTYIYAARCGWNHSNGVGTFWQLQKVNYEYTFCNSGNNIPTIATGSNAGVPTAVTLTDGATVGYVSPECQRVSLAMECVTANGTVSVAANNTAPIPFYIAQPATPTPQRAFVQLMLESAFVYYGSTDANGKLKLVGFEDVH